MTSLQVLHHTVLAWFCSDACRRCLPDSSASPSACILLWAVGKLIISFVCFHLKAPILFERGSQFRVEHLAIACRWQLEIDISNLSKFKTNHGSLRVVQGSTLGRRISGLLVQLAVAENPRARSFWGLATQMRWTMQFGKQIDRTHQSSLPSAPPPTTLQTFL